MATVSLLREGNPLARASKQLEVLAAGGRHQPFEKALAEAGLFPLRAVGIEVLQVNVGRLCNMTCKHCHVDAGPDRREIMSRQTLAACLDALGRTDIPTLDLTGGAPEMNPHFRWAVEEARRLGRRVIDRSNLTILLAPGYRDLPELLARNQVEMVASLPCYLEDNVDLQRGGGVFRKSIEALRRLNALGYGQPGSPLTLTLVYNPLGASLPPDQRELEKTYQHELKSRYGVVFSGLFTITNLPIGRFLNDLVRQGKVDQYMEKLIGAFNPAAAAGVMCRTTLSVDWTGRLYDCDFNQMLGVGLAEGLAPSIHEFDPRALARRRIVTGQHCYGCAAGAGSSCQGAIAQ